MSGLLSWCRQTPVASSNTPHRHKQDPDSLGCSEEVHHSGTGTICLLQLCIQPSLTSGEGTGNFAMIQQVVFIQYNLACRFCLPRAWHMLQFAS